MTKPNIILIVADDMGYGDFGVFNNQISCTPQLDALVAQGLTLTQHYSAAPVCAPARAALMTGATRIAPAASIRWKRAGWIACGWMSGRWPMC